ncbi:MAG: NAD(P)H-dependent oxidoreductase [Pseudomonadota bacterium]
MTKISIVVGHPRTHTFCEALGDAYLSGATEAGHEAQLFNTARMEFDPVLREGFDRSQPLEPDLEAAHSAMMAADHLVMIFPLWLGTMPAIFKGYLERVLQPELLEPAKRDDFPPILKGKSARVVMTMGMPGFVYRWWFGAHALQVVKRNILGFVGVSPIRSTIYGSVEQVGNEQRTAWLEEMRELGKRAD